MGRGRLNGSWQWVHLVGFPALLVAGAVLFVVSPKELISEREQRKLKPLPELTTTALLSGTYFRELEGFVADNFVFRDVLAQFAASARQAWGFDLGGVRLYADRRPGAPQGDGQAQAGTQDTGGSPGPAPGQGTLGPGGREAQAPGVGPEPVRHQGASPAAAPAASASTARGGQEASRQGAVDPYRSINSVLVQGRRAIQVFGGSDQRAVAFAQMVNRMATELGPTVSVYCMAIPIGSDFYLPQGLQKGPPREKTNIDVLYGQLAPEVRKVRAYEELSVRRDEYIQFRTDHHWTGRGAYYAYTAFANAAGFAPLPMSSLQHKVIPGFLGSLYRHTLADELRDHPDEVEVFMVPNRTEAFYFPRGHAKGVPTRMYAEGARGAYAYGVFLGADHALMRIVSDVGNGRRILVIKDSYGNAFVPYLAAHYEEIFVLDFRFFDGLLRDVMNHWNIRELLVAHNTFMINSGYTVGRGMTLIGDGKTPPLSRNAGASPAAAASAPAGSASAPGQRRAGA